MSPALYQGYPSNQKEYDEHKAAMLEKLNRENGVVESVDFLRGWHLAGAVIYKPGVYKFMMTRRLNNGAECWHGYAKQKLITTAIELGCLSKPNDYTLP